MIPGEPILQARSDETGGPLSYSGSTSNAPCGPPQCVSSHTWLWSRSPGGRSPGGRRTRRSTTPASRHPSDPVSTTVGSTGPGSTTATSSATRARRTAAVYHRCHYERPTMQALAGIKISRLRHGLRPRTSTRVMAHRWVWEQTNGPIPPGMVIMHVCDNKPCVELSHLRLGTQADNLADCVAKGRHREATRRTARMVIPSMRRTPTSGGISVSAVHASSPINGNIDTRHGSDRTDVSAPTFLQRLSELREPSACLGTVATARHYQVISCRIPNDRGGNTTNHFVAST